jgi:flagellar biosynthetic protein FliS
MNRAIGAYRSQQVTNTSPEQQAALLMEAGQVHIAKAIKAINEKDYNSMATALSRLCDVINEAIFRLDHESDGDLINNLFKIYN